MTTTTAIWSVVRGGGLGDHAVEPGPCSIEIPDATLDWAEGHGLSADDPDVYLLVTPADEAVEIGGELAYREYPMPTSDLATLRDALSE